MRVILLVHSDLIPPENVKENELSWDQVEWVTEYDVLKALKNLKHKVLVLGVTEDLLKIRKAIEDFKPHIVFNLLEEFKGEAIFDQHIVSYLELLGVPYTGCNPKGMVLGRDKALSKKILAFHKIKTPKFEVFPKNKKLKKTLFKEFPVIVKCLNEEASLGISQASVVKSPEKLLERVAFIHKNFNTAAIAEDFIAGTEYFVGVYGNYQIKTLPPFQLHFSEEMHPEQQLYSTNAKFNTGYRKRHKISTGPAQNLPTDLSKKLQHLSKRAYKVLGLNGYARMDLRVNPAGEVYLIEANPNPDISEFDDFASSAKTAGLSYPKVIDKILKLGKAWG